jgi:hypothetical protein
MVTAPIAFLIGRLGKLCIEAEGEYGSGPWSVFPGLLSDAGRGWVPTSIAGLAILGMGSGIVAALRARTAGSIRALQSLSVVLLSTAVVAVGAGTAFWSRSSPRWWVDSVDEIQDLTIPAIRIAIALSFVGLTVGWILAAIAEARRPAE